MKDPKRLTVLMIVVFIGITVVWLTSFIVLTWLFGKPNGPDAAGNLFGAIGALFSGWAFCGVLWAILLQHKALQVQREDLRATLDEMKQSREAHEQSAENLKAQVEAMRLQSRLSALTTLINVPLQIDGNSFLNGFSQKVTKIRPEFEQYVRELAELEKQLREKGE